MPHGLWDWPNRPQVGFAYQLGRPLARHLSELRMAGLAAEDGFCYSTRRAPQSPKTPAYGASSRSILGDFPLFRARDAVNLRLRLTAT